MFNPINPESPGPKPTNPVASQLMIGGRLGLYCSLHRVLKEAKTNPPPQHIQEKDAVFFVEGGVLYII